MSARFGSKVVAAASVAVALGGVVATASPALASSCTMYPGTNPITIRIGDGPGLAQIPGTPAGIVGECDDVSLQPNPSVDPDVTVDRSTGCTSPCFVIAWGGVTTGPVSAAVTLWVDGTPYTVGHSVPGENVGAFCVNSGMPCP